VSPISASAAAIASSSSVVSSVVVGAKVGVDHVIITASGGPAMILPCAITMTQSEMSRTASMSWLD